MTAKCVLVIIVVIFAFSSVVAAQQECPINSIWIECGSGCPPTCSQQVPPPNCITCVPRCQCNLGLVWNDANQCVSTAECPASPPV